MLEPYVRPGIDDRPDLDKVLSPEDKAAVARLAIKNRRRPPEASADQPEAQAVRLASAGSSAAAAAAASVGFLRCFNSGRRTLGGVEHHCHAQRDCAYVRL